MKFDDFLNLMDTLLGEDGCPWDREQTHESLRQYLLEECYETIEAINTGDMAALREELGDVLLQVVFHAKLAEKANAFTIDDVIADVSHKLTSRHTHVFGEDTAASAEEVIKVWEANKQKEQMQSTYETMMAVPKALPALMRASKVLKYAIGKPCIEDILRSLYTSLDMLAACAGASGNNTTDSYGHKAVHKRFIRQMGEMLLWLTILSNALKVNTELILAGAVDKYIARYPYFYKLFDECKTKGMSKEEALAVVEKESTSNYQIDTDSGLFKYIFDYDTQLKAEGKTEGLLEAATKLLKKAQTSNM